MRLAAVGVGPQRTGSSWLWECLRTHPELCFPAAVKETHFLDERFERGWAWYAAHFAHRRPGQHCVEISATYFDVPAAAARLHAHAPDCRVVVTLRDPAARAYSLYLHHRAKGRLRTDFEDALLEHPRLLEASRYARHLPRWRALFGDTRVQAVLLDDVAACPAGVLRQVHDFLGVAALPPPAVAGERVNPASLPTHPVLARLAARAAAGLRSGGFDQVVQAARRLGATHVYRGVEAPPLPPAARRRLVAELGPDIDYVETWLQRPLPAWRHVP